VKAEEPVVEAAKVEEPAPAAEPVVEGKLSPLHCRNTIRY
jgi:hypothetical protein